MKPHWLEMIHHTIQKQGPCEKRSQTDHGVQSEEETKDASTLKAGSKSEIMQAYLHMKNKILCIFGNMSPVFDKFCMENMAY